MDISTLVSLTGSLMSLFGILVSLFSIHLGNWLSKLQAIRAKWDANQSNKQDSRAAKRECRYEFREAFNFQPFVMTPIILGFSSYVLFFFHTLRTVEGIAFPHHYIFIFNLFFLIMISLSLLLLIWGGIVGFALRKKINCEFGALAQNHSE